MLVPLFWICYCGRCSFDYGFYDVFGADTLFEVLVSACCGDLHLCELEFWVGCVGVF